jgi:hypothetical protein
MPQSVVRIALRTLDFEKPFPTDPWKINNLTQTADQEVGGSNPPSCTKDLADPVSDSIFLSVARLRMPTCVAWQRRVMSRSTHDIAHV